MPSRRALLSAATAVSAAGIAGCADRIQTAFADEPPVEGPCPDSSATWPTAGGDPGRTGQAETSLPPSDADVVDLLAGVRDDGRQRLAAALPAVADGTAYVPASGGIVALDLDAPGDGPSWVRDLDDDVDAVPALACGVLLAPGLNELAALDPATGDPYWRADVGGHNGTTLGVLDETVYVASTSPTAVDVRTGEVRWTAHGGDTVALGDGGVYSTRNANGEGGIFAHDLDGTERWHLALGKIVGSASVRDGTVFVADVRGGVYAIDAATGETSWSRSLDGVRKVHSGVAVRGNDVVVPAGTGTASAVLDAATGATRWTANTGIVTGRPVVGEDWVAFGRTNEGVSVYDRATGDRLTTWSREEYGLGTISGIVPVENGLIVRGGTTSGLSLIR